MNSGDRRRRRVWQGETASTGDIRLYPGGHGQQSGVVGWGFDQCTPPYCGSARRRPAGRSKSPD